MKKLLALTAILMLAVSCKQAPPMQMLVPITFASKPALHVNVAEIKVIESYQSPMAAPNVEHEFHTTPAQALKIWAKQRLQAVGTTGVLEIGIDDASVKEVELPRKTGLEGFFSDEQSERYDGSIRVNMRLYTGQNAMADASGDVAVVRSTSIHEKATVAEREKLYNDLTQDMLTQFDAEAENRLRQYFAGYLR